ncbi:MAG TPA: hypothetical protein PLE24_00575 [Chitinispirillaceae bacterium]|nr:hypothetical protein [Chitinispirillaceae bacterium]
MKAFHTLIIPIFAIGLSVTAATNEIDLTVIAGAETHAMIEPCDCPQDPGGGLAKRSTLVKSIRKGDNLLLLDAGGFSGGGIYDSYTEGRSADSLRTIVTLRGMGAIGYDAVAIGDDDLQYGGDWLIARASEAGVPVVSVNCFDQNGKLLTAPYLLVKKGQYTFAITGLTSQEKLFETDRNLSIKDPVQSLRKVWKEMTARSDFQIILSHLGQESSIALKDSFPECDLIVNGHRKADTNPVIMRDNVPVMQFGFQGKSFSFVDLRFSGKRMSVIRSGWLNAGEEVKEDSSVAAILNLQDKKRENVYDLYIMSQCPYGLEALVSFVEFVKAFPELRWDIRFIGNVESDKSLSSLHGTGEIHDEMMWLAVKELYPEKWVQFLQKRAAAILPTESLIDELKMDKGKIGQWVASKGKSELTVHYNRSERQNINASPTLMINNIPYEGRISKLRLARIECSGNSGVSKFCDSIPQCIDDSDCRRPGKIGKCVSGDCEFRDAVRFDFTVLVADSTLQHPESSMIMTTHELFPGATVKTFTLNSKQGKELLKKFNPDALPFYVFGREVRQTQKFGSIESGLIEKNGGLIFKEGIVRKNYFHRRELKRGTVVLFVDPFFPEIPAVLKTVLDDSVSTVEIKPVFYGEPSKTLRGTEEYFRQEESQRWLLLALHYKTKFASYLKEYAENPGSSYWSAISSKSGINPDSLTAAVLGDTNSLEKHMKLLKSLSVNEPLVLLLDNRETVTAGSMQELTGILSTLQKKGAVKDKTQTGLSK